MFDVDDPHPDTDTDTDTDTDLGTPASESPEVVALTIDGVAVRVPAGTSVMRAAIGAGIQVPALCATDSLEPFGSCRLCLVEIDGRRGTPASCTTPVEAGMAVRTQSAKLRQGVMELYISAPPLDCLTCSANGDCERQDMAGAVGLRDVRYGFEGVNPLRGQNHMQGSCDMGSFPHELPGYRHVGGAEVRALFGQAWGVTIQPEPGRRIPHMFDAALSGDFEGLYGQGEDIVQSDPDTRHVAAAMQAMECGVVQDIFLNETAKYAPVFLPGSSFLEKDGTFTNAERRISRVRKVMPPLSGVGDWEATCLLATALGYPMLYTHPREIMDEIAFLTPAFAGVVYTTFHFPESGANVITTDSADWATDCPEYKVTAVQLMPVAQPSTWQPAYRDFDADQQRFLADAKLGRALDAAVTAGGR